MSPHPAPTLVTAASPEPDSASPSSSSSSHQPGPQARLPRHTLAAQTPLAPRGPRHTDVPFILHLPPCNASSHRGTPRIRPVPAAGTNPPKSRCPRLCQTQGKTSFPGWGSQSSPQRRHRSRIHQHQHRVSKTSQPTTGVPRPHRPMGTGGPVSPSPCGDQGIPVAPRGLGGPASPLPYGDMGVLHPHRLMGTGGSRGPIAPWRPGDPHCPEGNGGPASQLLHGNQGVPIAP